MMLRIKNPLPKRTGPVYDPRIHGIRQSQIQTWQTCREAARLGTVYGWRSIHQGLPLVFGSLSHGVLKQAYRAARGVGARAAKCSPDNFDMEQMLKESERELLEENPNPPTAVRDMVEESVCILSQTLPTYFTHWWKDDTSIQWKMVEDKFKLPMKMPDGETVYLTGTFDGTFIKDGNAWVFETKNKSRWSDNFAKMLPMDLQVGVYLTALHRLHGVRPVGVRYNLMRRPGERLKKGESKFDFATRIGFNVENDPAHYFERLDIELTPQEHGEHLARTEALVREFYSWWKSSDHQKRDLLWNSAACEGKFAECQFLHACADGDFTACRQRKPDVL